VTHVTLFPIIDVPRARANGRIREKRHMRHLCIAKTPALSSCPHDAESGGSVGAVGVASFDTASAGQHGRGATQRLEAGEL